VAARDHWAIDAVTERRRARAADLSSRSHGGWTDKVQPVPIFDVPKRFSRQWVARKVPQMDSTEFHAMFHEAATRGWDEDELRQLARMWGETSGVPATTEGDP
jgi:hypothetical protein